MKAFFGILAVLATTTSLLSAATRTAASANFADVSTVVAAAARGDTVQVPAGTVTWSGKLTLNRGVKLLGAGYGSTIITLSGTGILISPDATAISNEEEIRVEGFTFDGNNSAVNLIMVQGAGASSSKAFKNLVVGKNRFRNGGNITSGMIKTLGQTRGVIYSNIFDRCNVILTIMGNDTATECSNGHFPLTYGTADNLFFEGNSIQYSSSYTASDPGWTETGQGARLVERYNTWNMNNTSEAELWDIHGFQYWVNGTDNGGVASTGTMLSEYYGNSGTNMKGYRWVNLRGGWGLFFNNMMTGTGGMSIETAAYSGSCPSDVGSQNYNPSVTNTYFWNNTKNGSIANAVDGGVNYCGIADNRNWYNYNASFSGTTGIGRGTTAPTMNCTAGVGYWVASTATPTTDPSVIQNGVFYKATANNTWTAYYRPYMFPHPLAAGGLLTNGVISVSPNSLNFGSVVVGATNDLTFTVQNVGGGTLTGFATVAAPFSIRPGSAYNLGPGQSQTVTVGYNPTAVRTDTQNVTFTGGGGANAAVSGAGVSASAKPEPPTGLRITAK